MLTDRLFLIPTKSSMPMHKLDFLAQCASIRQHIFWQLMIAEMSSIR